MPIKKPKPVKMPTPFAAQELSDDDDARRRAILMKRELEQAGGFSWNEPKQGFFTRIRNQPRHKVIAGVLSLGMAGAIVSAFLIGIPFLLYILLFPFMRIGFVRRWTSRLLPSNPVMILLRQAWICFSGLLPILFLWSNI